MSRGPSQPYIVDIPLPRFWVSQAKRYLVGSNLVNILQETKSSGSGEHKPDGRHTELGGLRVILVRDGQTQKELQGRVEGSTVVSTILQSKGMEFEDVFLYNFFTSSPCRSSLTLLHNLLHKSRSVGMLFSLPLATVWLNY